MQTQIDYLNITNLAQISLGTVAGSAVFNGFFINDDGTTTSTSFTVQPTQQSLQSIFGSSVYENCLVLVNVPSFYLGMNGLLNGNLGSNTSYLTITAGSYRLGGHKNSTFDRIFRNLIPQPLDGSPLSIVAGYDSVNSVVRPITVSPSGNINVYDSQIHTDLQTVETILSAGSFPAGSVITVTPSSWLTGTDWSPSSVPPLPSNIKAMWIGLPAGTQGTVCFDGGGAFFVLQPYVSGGWLTEFPATNITKIHSPSNGSSGMVISFVVS